jgi:hypothetical protein
MSTIQVINNGESGLVVRNKLNTNFTNLNADKIESSEKGAANGVAPLDALSKISASYLPTTAMEYKGNWNALTNSPSLIDGIGSAGDVYRVNVAGTQNLGSGAIEFAIGDLIIYSGIIWEKADNTEDPATTKNNVAQQFTKQHNPLGVELTVVDGKIDWNLDNAQVAFVTITTDTLLNVAQNPQEGGRYVLFVIASGGAQLSFAGDDFYSFTGLLGPASTPDGVSKLKFDFINSKMRSDIPPGAYVSQNPIPALIPKRWYNANEYGGNQSNVLAVIDQGSNGFDGSKQGTGNITITNLNSIPTFDLGSTNNDRAFNFGAIPCGMSAGARTMFAVVKPSVSDNVDRTIRVFSTNFDSDQLSLNASTGEVKCFLFDDSPGSSSQLQGIASDLSQGIVITWLKNAGGTDSKLRINGVEVDSVDQPETPDGNAVEALIGIWSSGAPFRGQIGEYVEFDSALLLTDIQSVEIWLMNKFGII